MMTNAQWVPPSPITVKLLEFMQLSGVGPAKARELVRSISMRNNFPIDLNEAITKHSRSSTSNEQRNMTFRSAEMIVDKCSNLGISIISLIDPEYPKLLSQISDAPPILYVLGSVPSLSKKAVAVVGTRDASSRGLQIAEMISRTVVQEGFSVVSGLAFGIDKAAHQAALNAGGVTIAVMAHGLDMVSPQAHKDLAERIIAEKGALVSEHPPGTPAFPAEFVRRNRIQSGLSLCSIIVESGREGGAIHQARFTKAQKREVYVSLPSDNLDNEFKRDGADYLINEMGAIPLRNTGDLKKVLLSLKDNMNNSSSKEVPGQDEFNWK